MNPIQQFYLNENMRESVKEFFLLALKEIAVDRVFGKQTISGVYEAKKTIDLAFSKMEELYAPKEGPISSNSR